MLTRRHLAPLPPALLALLLLTSAAKAETPPTPQPRLIVLETHAVGGVDPKTVAGISAYLASEAAKGKMRVLAASDVGSMLGLERQKQLLGCSDESCLFELAGALGAEYLLSSEVSEIGGEWMLTVALLDMQAARAQGRTTRRAPDLKDLLALVPVAVGTVLQPVTGIAPPPEPLLEPHRPLRPLGFVLDGAAVALAVAGGVFQFNSAQAWAEAQQLGAAGRDFTAYQLAKTRSDNELIAAGLLYGAGAVALGFGLYFTFAGGNAPSTSVAFAPTPNGGLLVAGGTF